MGEHYLPGYKYQHLVRAFNSALSYCNLKPTWKGFLGSVDDEESESRLYNSCPLSPRVLELKSF